MALISINLPTSATSAQVAIIKKYLQDQLDWNGLIPSGSRANVTFCNGPMTVGAIGVAIGVRAALAKAIGSILVD